VQEQKKKLAEAAAAAQHSADSTQSNSSVDTESDATSDDTSDAAAQVTHTMLFGHSLPTTTAGDASSNSSSSSGTTLVLRECAIDRPDTPFAGSDGSCQGMLTFVPLILA
jgi:hypothetical protein